MKKIATLITASLISTPAFAGPYLNVETKAKYTGSDYKSRATDLHVGYENKFNDLAYYIQGGKTIKIKLNGEVSFAQVEDADNNYATKLGVKYSF